MSLKNGNVERAIINYLALSEEDRHTFIYLLRKDYSITQYYNDINPPQRRFKVSAYNYYNTNILEDYIYAKDEEEVKELIIEDNYFFRTKEEIEDIVYNRYEGLDVDQNAFDNAIITQFNNCIVKINITEYDPNTDEYNTGNNENPPYQHICH